jgi:hypothetical protein
VARRSRSSTIGLRILGGGRSEADFSIVPSIPVWRGVPELVAMCGRFTQKVTWHEIRDLYELVGDAGNLQALGDARQITFCSLNHSSICLRAWSFVRPYRCWIRPSN